MMLPRSPKRHRILSNACAPLLPRTTRWPNAKKQNREAAQKSRERKRDLMSTLVSQVAALEEQNKALQSTVTLQNEQIRMLMARLNEQNPSTMTGAASDAKNITQPHQSTGFLLATKHQISSPPSILISSPTATAVESHFPRKTSPSLVPLSFGASQIAASNFESAELVSPQLEVLAAIFLCLTSVVHFLVASTLAVASQTVQVRAFQLPNKDGTWTPYLRLRVRKHSTTSPSAPALSWKTAAQGWGSSAHLPCRNGSLAAPSLSNLGPKTSLTLTSTCPSCPVTDPGIPSAVPSRAWK